jgi:hypothetical protein
LSKRFGDVDAVRRLDLEIEEGGIEDQCPGKSNALLLAARELGRLPPGEALQSDETERLLGQLPAL